MIQVGSVNKSMKCMNEKCTNDPENSPEIKWWGYDGDACCNQHCYDETRKQFNLFCSVTLTDDKKFADWMDQ